MLINSSLVNTGLDMATDSTSVNVALDILTNSTSVATLLDMVTNSTTVTGTINMSTPSTTEAPCVHPLADTPVERFTDFMKDPVSCIIILLCLLGFVFNILTIIATAMIPSGQSVHSKLIISLGLSDILITIGVIIHFLFVIAVGKITLTQFSVKKAFVDLGFHATLSNLLVMAADHYLAIMKPLKYVQIMTPFRGHCVLAAIWVTSFIFGVLDFLLTKYGDFEWQYIVTGTTIVVFLLIVGIYTKIYMEVRTLIFRSRSIHSEDLHTTKAIITTSFIIITFFICWMPNVAFNVFVVIKTHHDPHLLDDCSRHKLLRKLAMFFIIPMVTNTVCDPLIYATRLNKVQMGYRVMFRKLFPKLANRRVSRHYTIPKRERRDTTITLINSNSFKENELRQVHDENYHEDNTTKLNGIRHNVDDEVTHDEDIGKRNECRQYGYENNSNGNIKMTAQYSDTLRKEDTRRIHFKQVDDDNDNEGRKMKLIGIARYGDENRNEDTRMNESMKNEHCVENENEDVTMNGGDINEDTDEDHQKDTVEKPDDEKTVLTTDDSNYLCYRLNSGYDS